MIAHEAPFRAVLLTCRKCGKRLGGGFGPRGEETLARMLRRALREDGRRGEVRVLETGCQGLCPKGAVSVIGPADQTGSPVRIWAVPRGTEAKSVLARLLGARGGSGGGAAGEGPA